MTPADQSDLLARFRAESWRLSGAQLELFERRLVNADQYFRGVAHFARASAVREGFALSTLGQAWRQVGLPLALLV